MVLAERDRMTDIDEEQGDEPDPIAAVIDRNLRLVYSDLASEELPDRFKDLLAVLKAQDSEGGDAG